MNLFLIELPHLSVYEQLQLEEALLRTDERSFCLINYGSPRTIVMGQSAVPEELLHLDLVCRDAVAVCKRYSGGGTVIIDEQTLLISFLFSKKDLPISPFPESILRWSAELYQNAWRLPHFSLREQDYAILDRKCGGNAQYLRKDRWLHHTSFLWDYQEKNMQYLSLPKKQPAYRLGRPHADFLCRLKDYAPSLESLVESLKTELVKRFYFQTLSYQEIEHVRLREHRKSTHQIPF